jgi:hypothetical protein
MMGMSHEMVCLERIQRHFFFLKKKKSLNKKLFYPPVEVPN